MVLSAYAVALVPAVVMAMGAVLLIEMSYRLSTQPELGTRMRLLWVNLDAATPWPWIAAALLLVAGFHVFRTTWRQVAAAWSRASDEARTRKSAQVHGEDQFPRPSPGQMRPRCGCEDIRKSFGATPIIRGVSLDIFRGERHAIIGPNGAGKSTLFNLISGRCPPTKGSIQLNGEEVAGRALIKSTAGDWRAASR